nr:MAG: CO dehydrogenase flavoprotein C-terminal domain-containing protein [Candidatus Kentron sp. LFY]
MTLDHAGSRRRLALKDFFQGYKKLDKRNSESMEKISFPLPAESTLFNFEKVSKRAHFDIASVNSAIWITLDGGIMRQVHLSAGGVAPIPLYLSDTSHYSTGRKPDIDTVREAASIAQSEISPIGDVRGSAVYKRLLPRQLIHAHFITLFPEKIPLEGLLDSSANTSSGNL